MNLERETTTEYSTLLNGLYDNWRFDGRRRDEFRGIKLALGSELGTAMCVLGKTKVFCSVHQEIATPALSKPDRGFIEVEADMNMAIVRPDQRREARDKMRELRTVMQTILKDNCIDEAQLSIRKAEEAWKIVVSVRVLNNDGGLLTCATIAATAALKHCRVYQHMHRSQKRTVILSESHYAPFNLVLVKLPVCLAFGFFDERKIGITDPDLREERYSTGMVWTAVTERKELSVLQMSRGFLVTPQIIKMCTQHSIGAIGAIAKLIETKVFDDTVIRSRRYKPFLNFFNIEKNSSPVQFFDVEIDDVEARKFEASKTCDAVMSEKEIKQEPNSDNESEPDPDAMPDADMEEHQAQVLLPLDLLDNGKNWDLKIDVSKEHLLEDFNKKAVFEAGQNVSEKNAATVANDMSYQTLMRGLMSIYEAEKMKTAPQDQKAEKAVFRSLKNEFVSQSISRNQDEGILHRTNDTGFVNVQIDLHPLREFCKGIETSAWEQRQIQKQALQAPASEKQKQTFEKISEMSATIEFEIPDIAQQTQQSKLPVGHEQSTPVSKLQSKSQKEKALVDDLLDDLDIQETSSPTPKSTKPTTDKAAVSSLLDDIDMDTGSFDLLAAKKKKKK